MLSRCHLRSRLPVDNQLKLEPLLAANLPYSTGSVSPLSRYKRPSRALRYLIMVSNIAKKFTLTEVLVPPSLNKGTTASLRSRKSPCSKGLNTAMTMETSANDLDFVLFRSLVPS